MYKINYYLTIVCYIKKNFWTYTNRAQCHLLFLNKIDNICKSLEKTNHVNKFHNCKGEICRKMKKKQSKQIIMKHIKNA